jgi:hypothetical protein
LAYKGSCQERQASAWVSSPLFVFIAVGGSSLKAAQNHQAPLACIDRMEASVLPS